MPRFFVAKGCPNLVTGSDAHHIKNVLRLKAGDALELLDGSGQVYAARIIEFGKDKVVCEIVSASTAQSEPKAKITLAQALPKAQKMDLIVEKSTELGAASIIPMISERTIGKKAKIERWQKIAKSAAEQSGRAIIPEIQEIKTFSEILKLRSQFDLALITWELEKEKTLKQVLTSPSNPYPLTSNILLLIGPEGGFSQTEIEQAKSSGFIPISLGKRILRTETAGLAVLSMITYELG